MTMRIRPFTLAILGLGLLSLLLLVPRWTGSSPARKRPQDQPTPSADVEPTVSTANPAAERDPAHRPPTFPGPGPQTKRVPPGANPLDKLAKSITAMPPGSAASYVIRDRDTAAFFTSKGVTLAAAVPNAGGGKPIPGVASMNWGLVGARETEPRPEGEKTEVVNQYLGDSSKWTTNQKTYSSVVYDDVRPGVSMVVESNLKSLKYTLRVAPGADASNLRFRYEGARGVQVVEDGAAVEVLNDAGILRESGLVCYQDGPSGRNAIDARYESTGPSEYAIVLGEYDPAVPLTIDPAIGWSTLYGGNNSPTGMDDCYAVAYSPASGDIYVTGTTFCINFPSVLAPYNTLKGSMDGFLAKISPTTGQIQWATYIGGTGAWEYCYAATVDPSGNIYVTGYTVSSDFPIIGPSHKSTLSGYDAFVVKFSPTGVLLKSTYLGGNSSDYAYAIASDATGVYVGGFTYSSNFQIIGGFRPTIGPTPDAFVAKLDPTLSTLLWSSFVGGNDQDYIYGIAVDSASPANVYVTGQTYSSDFPASPALYPNYGGNADSFLMKLTQPTPNSVAMAWTTYLGGSSYDFGTGVCVTTDQDPVAVGYTYSYSSIFPNVPFPTVPGSYKTSATSVETFVTRVKADGSSVVYSTFLGGTSTDYGRAIAPGQSGTVYVTGQTYSSDFPFSATAYKKTASTTPDAFVSRLSADGKLLEASTYVSGTGTDDGKGIVVLNGFGGTVNGVYVTGNTTSADLPLPPPATINRSLGGQQDAFLTKFTMDLATCPWTTFVGGSVALADSQGTAIAIDPSTPNMVYVTGYTTSLDFPVQAPAPPGTADLAIGGTQDVFIAKIFTNAGGAPVVQWSTYLGGSQQEWSSAIAVDSAGFVYVVGQTTSSDFPLAAGPGAGGLVADSVYAGGSEAFVTQLQPNGQFYYSTFLGGSGTDYAKGIAVDSGFNAFITGYTNSSNFPLLNAFKTIPSTLPEVFVTKLNVSGLGLWSSYLGGNSSDYASGIACDQAGTICYVTGYTYSSDFPATVGGASLGYPDAFVTAIQGVPSPGPAPTVHWSRYLGGLDSDYGYAIAVNPAGTDLYVVGYTYSNTFPTVNALRPTLNGIPDSFVTKLVPGSGAGAGSIIWSTYLGGSSSDYAQAAAVDAAGNVYVAGYTWSWDFHNKGAFQPGNNGLTDGFVTKIKSDGSAIVWSSQIGGSSYDEAHGVAVDSNGVVYLTGFTQSNNFPYVNGIENVFGGLSDAFIVRLDNANPDPPDLLSVGMGQFKTTGGASIGVGGWTNENSFQVKTKVTDSDEDKVKLQVEIRPVGTPFNEATMSVAANTLAETGFFDSGTSVSLTVTFPNPAPATFHWRARTVDNSSAGRKSAWVNFGNNSDAIPPGAAPDIGVDLVNPTVTITSPTNLATHYMTGASVVVSGTSADDVNGSTVTSGTWSTTAAVVPNSGPVSVTVGGLSWNAGSINLAVGQNPITIKLFDAAGNQGTATITVWRDNTAPSLTITENNFSVGVNSATLNGTTSDNLANPPHPLPAISWSNNRGGTGTGTVAVGGGWSASITGLQAGSNIITVTSTDAAGNPTQSARTIFYDIFAPSVFIGSPASGTISTSATVLVSGSASDNDAVNTITAKNVTTGLFYPVTVAAPGLPSASPNWSSTITLAQGANTIQITATDRVNLSNSSSIIVWYDQSPPSVAITVPGTNPFPTASSPITLSGTASDTDTGILSVDWSAPTGSGSTTLTNPGALSTNWNSPLITLNPGDNLITITAKDKGNRTTSTSITIILSSIAPSIVVNTPATNPFVTNLNSVTISGTATDSDGTVNQITCQNTTTLSSSTVTPGSVLPAASTTWSTSVVLQGGINDIAITATDNTGNITVVNRTIIYDQSQPVVKITGPTTADTYFTGVGTLNLTGTATDNRGVTSLSWTNSAGGGGVLAVGSPWTIPSIVLADGTQTITVTAKDEANNISTDTLVVTYDHTLPTITIEQPVNTDTYVTLQGTIDLAGVASNDTFLFTWVNARTGLSGNFPGSTSWNVNGITLLPGANPITIIAMDEAGNVQTDTLIAYLDTEPPKLTVTDPAVASVSINSSKVRLAGTASDDVGIKNVSWLNLTNSKFGTAVTTDGWATWEEVGADLDPGDNKIQITVTDQSDQQFSLLVFVHYDPNAPILSIVQPGSDPARTTATPLDLSGTASDILGDGSLVDAVKVVWDNLTTGATGSAGLIPGAWSGQVPLTSGSNAIQVTAYDAAGNTAVQLITVIYDTADPLITITDPTTNLNYLTNVQPVLLGGTTSDDLGVTKITWTSSAGGGGIIGPPYNAWSQSIPLAAGPNLITVTAEDAAGRTGIARIQIVYDPTPPDLSIVQPTSASIFKSTTSPLTLAGTASDNVGIDSVTWKNTSTGITGTATGGTGAWTITGIGLIQGDNVINVTAADTVGNTKTVVVTVSYDGSPPTVDISIPVATGTYGPINVRPLLIGGNAADNLELTSVTWVNSKGGSGTAWSGSSTAVAWSDLVYLYSGDNVITVTATDGHGYSTVAVITVNFFLEGEAPGIQITVPSNTGSAVSASQIVTVSGTADDNIGVVAVKWFNQTTGMRGTMGITPHVPATVPPSFDWTGDVPLTNGSNVIIVTAVDDANNRTSATIAVTYTSPPDTEAPTNNITGPTSNPTWDESVAPMLLTVTAIDNVGVAGVSYTNSGTNVSGTLTPIAADTWIAWVSLAPGPNVLEVTVVDAVGNSAVDTLLVTFAPAPGDLVPPVVAVKTYTSGTGLPQPYVTGTTVNVSDPNLEFAGTSSDAILVAGVVWNDAGDNNFASSGTADGTTDWTGFLVLQPGLNLVTVKAYDSSGLWSKDQITVRYTPPPFVPPPVHIAAGACGLTGMEVLLPLAFLAALRRRLRKGRGR